jgi:hypothetical protein
MAIEIHGNLKNRTTKERLNLIKKYSHTIHQYSSGIKNSSTHHTSTIKPGQFGQNN